MVSVHSISFWVLLVSLDTVPTAVTVFFPPLLKLQYHPIIDDFYISLNNVIAWRVVSYLEHETWWIVALKVCSLCIPWLATTTISSSAHVSLHCIHHLDCYTVTSNKHKQPGQQDKACNKLYSNKSIKFDYTDTYYHDTYTIHDKISKNTVHSKNKMPK